MIHGLVGRSVAKSAGAMDEGGYLELKLKLKLDLESATSCDVPGVDEGLSQ